MMIGGLELGSKRAPDRREEDDTLLDFDFSTEVVFFHPLDPNPGNNNTNTRRSFVQKKYTRRRRISSHKVVDNELVSKFLKDANGDILLEIFVRLGNCRSAILLGSVCHRWHALISHPKFIPRFIRLHSHDQSAYTFLLCRNPFIRRDEPEIYYPICKLFSKESLFLHGKKHATSSNYLDFMPSPVEILASFNDLLLVTSLERLNFKYFICNPVTKRWFPLPADFPFGSMIGFALICMPNNAQCQFKVVLIGTPEPPPLGENADCQTRVAVFCSTSGRWTRPCLCVSYPQSTKNDYSFNPEVVSINGILYWMDGEYYLDRVLALDLFNGHCAAIYFPHVIHNDVSNVKVHLGVVMGELRVLHIYRTTCSSRKCFVIKVWELNRGDNSWVSVLERNLNMPNVVKKVDSVVFHPNNCDVVFMTWGMRVFECRISKDMFHELGELQEFPDEEGLYSFTLVHPPWPTPLPPHPPFI